MPDDVTGVYRGQFKSLEEVIELTADNPTNGYYHHRIYLNKECKLEETGCYSVGYMSIDFFKFTMYINFDDLLKDTCPTNGNKYEFVGMIYSPRSKSGVDRIIPHSNFDFCYKRVGLPKNLK